MAKLFAYGSLMLRHKNKSTSFPAYLENYKISFKVKGPACEPSFAMLEPCTGEKAHGVVIDLPPKKLRRYIAHELSYSSRIVTAFDCHGNSHQCIALFLKVPGYDQEVMPSARYANLLYSGALYHSLPAEVTDYYLRLKKTGNKYTYYLRFLTPLVRKLLPITGRNFAHYGSYFGLPLLTFAILLIILFKIFGKL